MEVQQNSQNSPSTKMHIWVDADSFPAPAKKTLLKAAKKANNKTLSPTFLIQAGQLFEALDKQDRALECYKQVKEKYQQSYEYNNIDKYIERLQK